MRHKMCFLYAAVAAVSYCRHRCPPGHLCDAALTSTTTLALVGAVTVGTEGGLDHHVASVSAIDS